MGPEFNEASGVLCGQMVCGESRPGAGERLVLGWVDAIQEIEPFSSGPSPRGRV